MNAKRVPIVCRRLLVCVLVGAAGGTSMSVHADDAIAVSRATVRTDPSTKKPPIHLLEPGEEIEVIDANQVSGYFRVRTEEGDEGWVYHRSLQLVTPPVQPVSPAAAPVSPGSAPTSGTLASVSSSVRPTWDKPEPNTTVFDGPDGHCGPTGSDGGDTFTNRRKNRTDLPTEFHPVTWAAVRGLPDPGFKQKSLDDWTAGQIAQLRPYEGVPVTVVGYIAKIKVQSGGKGEATNCHFTNRDEVDWHIPFVQNAGDDESTSIVIETTPRVRAVHPKWTPKELAPWVQSDSPVRISGWTLFDPEHRAHLGVYRATLWEIHPIMKIEVFQDGQWVNADELK
jgi:hypothetical protein